MNCARCQVTDQEQRLEICTICKKLFCHDCAYAFAGKNFCGKGCGSYFFFGEGDEDMTEDEA